MRSPAEARNSPSTKLRLEREPRREPARAAVPGPQALSASRTENEQPWRTTWRVDPLQPQRTKKAALRTREQPTIRAALNRDRATGRQRLRTTIAAKHDLLFMDHKHWRITFDVRGGPLAGRPLDGGVRPPVLARPLERQPGIQRLMDHLTPNSSRRRCVQPP